MTDTLDFAAPRPVDLTRRRMETLSPLLEETWRYWSSLRPDGGVPFRSAVEPAAMSLILGHAMILDRIRPGMVRVRIGGRAMSDLMGMEVRGLPVRAFFEIDQRGRATDLFERVFTEPATLELDLACEAAGAAVRGRMLVLPLRDRDGLVTKALTCLAADRARAEPPNRFRIRNATLSPVAAASDPGRGLRAGATDGAAAARPSPRPYLRVVK